MTYDWMKFSCPIFFYYLKSKFMEVMEHISIVQEYSHLEENKLSMVNIIYKL